MPADSDVQHYLFLQGPHGPFYRQLAQALILRGLHVQRIAINSGDWLDSRGMPTIAYRGCLADWGHWLRPRLQQWGVTDVLLYGDCRPYHRQAIIQCRQLGIRVHVLEEGYIRPRWVTLEPDGVNGYSRLPGLFDHPEQQACLPMEKGRYHFRDTGKGLRWLVAWCIRYYLARLLDPVFFPHYCSHRVHPYIAEGWAWIKRLPTIHWRRRQALKRIPILLSDADRHPFFVVPLQLDTDAQIQVHSSFSNLQDMLEQVMRSFAAHAPASTRLVIKRHPLDHGLVNYRRVTAMLANKLGISDRVVFLDSGHLPTLLDHARGVITVNSTVGLQAIHHQCPVQVLGQSIYNMQGLVDTQPLESFWQAPVRPNVETYQAFRDLVMRYCQVNGNFYTPRGRLLLQIHLPDRLIHVAPKAHRYTVANAQAASDPVCS